MQRWLYLPEHLSSPPAEIKDAAEYILHRIFVGKALWNTAKGFTNLKAEYLRDQIGPSYKPAIEWLLTHGIVLTDNRFVVGQKCRGYRWSADAGDAVRVEASTELSAKIAERTRRTFRHFKRAHKHLFAWQQEIEIDMDGAKAHFATLPLEHDLRKPDTQQAVLATIRLLRDKDSEFSVCRYGRVHTALTRLAKEMRPYVSIHGRKLVNIDVKNSQPLILALLLSPPSTHLPPESTYSLSLQKEATSTRSPSESFRIPIPPSLYSDSDPATAPVTLCTSNDISNVGPKPVTGTCDIKRYIEVCEAGKLYEYLMEAIQCADRDKLKTDLFEQVLYGKGRRETRLVRCFKENFPSVWRRVQRYKKNDYRRLSHAMQRAESRLMIDAICLRLAEEHPEVPVLTIHDSIMTHESSTGIVQQIMAEEYAKVGLRPTMKIS